jgi:hypothetical protein
MAKTALINTDYEAIKAHIIAPDKSSLSHEHQFQLERILSISRVFDKNPILHHAIELHKRKYPEISDKTARNDADFARKLYNSIHNFDYDFWQAWLINNIIENIKRARNEGTPASMRVIAMEHSNLLKALGTKPEIPNDPRLTEKHEFYVLIQNNNNTLKIDYNLLKQLPKGTLKELNEVLFAAGEITEEQAAEIMDT